MRYYMYVLLDDVREYRTDGDRVWYLVGGGWVEDMRVSPAQLDTSDAFREIPPF